MSKLLSYFSYEYSRFVVQRSKESTARVALWRELKLPAVYTMEASFCGADRGPLSGSHFSTQHLEECGRKLCEALILFSNLDVKQVLSKVPGYKKKWGEETEDEKRAELGKSYNCFKTKDLMKELLSNKSLWNSGNELKSEGSSGGSDDDPSGDNLNEDEIVKIIPQKAKKKFVEERREAEREALRRKAEEARIAKEKQEEFKK